MIKSKILALILAGGTGGRLETLTENRAKPVLPFGGFFRLIDFALSNCAHSKISDVWVIEQYELHTLNEHLSNGRPWDLDRTYGGMLVLPPFENENKSDGADGGFARGNADAIYRHHELIRRFDPEILLVLSADHIYKLDFRDVIEAHLKNKAEVTMVTTKVPPNESASRFGVVKTGPDGRITDFVENGRAFEFRYEGYWRDVGTVSSYWRANMDLLDEDSGLNLDERKWSILTLAEQRIPAFISAEAEVTNSLIAAGCKIHGRVFHSVLGAGVTIEKGAEVRDSIILEDAVVKSGAQIRSAIIDTGAVIDNSATIGDIDGKKVAPKTNLENEEITIIGQNVRIAAHQKVDTGARVGREKKKTII
jgi:glucose-1-phosphate adenylyltransferase